MRDWKDELGYKSVSELFSSETEKHFEIPAYQRHFTWDKSSIEELITDICTHISTLNKDIPYHLGSLVLAQKKDSLCYEIIDGQQRCITLWLILHALLKALNQNQPFTADNKLKFSEVRTLANKFLEKIQNKGVITDEDRKTFSENGGTHNLLIAYDYLGNLFQEEKQFQKVQKANKDKKINREEFKDFLLEKTFLLQTVLPPGADVSLYFERMNDRGEQMQATDIVKTFLFESLSSSTRSYAETLWSACSNMNRFIQSNFETSKDSQAPLSREKLFSDRWTDFCPNEVNSILPETLSENNAQKNDDVLPFEELLKKKCVTENTYRPDSETFVSVTDFPHLLLHALNICEEKKSSEPIALNEDKLIDEFKKRKDKWEDKENVKAFLFTLLKCRYLLDTYVIKSLKKDDESWNLWRYEKTQNNNQSISLMFDEHNPKARSIQLLLSAMHCSNSNKNYKNWLDCTLRWLYKHAPVSDIRSLKDHQNNEFINSYETFLRTLAFLFFVNSEDTNNLRKWASGDTEISFNYSMPDFNKSLTYPAISVYRLNYIDYLLYEKYSGQEEFLGIKTAELNLPAFRFSSARTSIDHFVAQTRPEGFDKGVYVQIDIHSLANLSLMSPEQNSRHLNDAPSVKKEEILKPEKTQRRSLSLKTLVTAYAVDSLNRNNSLIPNKWNELQEKFKSLISEDYQKQKLNL